MILSATVPLDRLGLLGHEDDAHAAFADLLQQLVGADHRAGALGMGSMVEGCDHCGGYLEKPPARRVIGQQWLHFAVAAPESSPHASSRKCRARLVGSSSIAWQKDGLGCGIRAGHDRFLGIGALPLQCVFGLKICSAKFQEIWSDCGRSQLRVIRPNSHARA